MPKTFMGMFEEASAEVPAISPSEAEKRLREKPDTLLIDVRDEERLRATGKIPAAVPISAGSLLFKADKELPPEFRDPRVQDRKRSVIVHCDLGPLSAIAAKNLKDMGFEDVAFIEGGIEAWKAAGLPVGPHSG